MKVNDEHWWYTKFGPETVSTSYSLTFFPALFECQKSIAGNDTFTREELQLFVKYCIAGSAWKDDRISFQEFTHYLAHFGPLNVSLSKVLQCFCVHETLVPWFHGTMVREDAERKLREHAKDGSFLIRFSASHPLKFTLSYLRITRDSNSNNVVIKMRNCLIENIGYNNENNLAGDIDGYALSDSPSRIYPSIASFVQSSVTRLQHAVVSQYSILYQKELQKLKERQYNSYMTFNADAFTTTTSHPNGVHAHMNNTKSDHSYPYNNQLEHPYGVESQALAEDSYSTFTTADFHDSAQSHSSGKHFRSSSDHITNSTKNLEISNCGLSSSYSEETHRHYPEASDDYASFSEQNNGQFGSTSPPIHIRTKSVDIQDEYASFEQLTTLSWAHNTSVHDNHFRSTSNHIHSNSAHSNNTSIPPSNSIVIPSNRHLSNGRNTEDTYGSFESLFPSGAQLSNSFDPKDESPYGSFSTKQSLESLRSGNPSSSNIDKQEGNTTYGAFPNNQSVQPSQIPEQRMNTIGNHTPTDDYGNFMSAKASIPSCVPVKRDSEEIAKVGAVNNQTEHDKIEESNSPSDLALKQLNAGMAYFKERKLRLAIECFLKAQQYAEGTQSPHVSENHDPQLDVIRARALGNLGTVYMEFKDGASLERAVSCYEECLALTQRLGDKKKEFTILNNLILALMQCRALQKALRYCEVQLNMTTNVVNQQKIKSRMKFLQQQLRR